MTRYQAIVVTAAVLLTVAGCGGSRGGASPSAGSSASSSPAASIPASPPQGAPRPSLASQRTPAAKPLASANLHGTVYVIKAGDTLYGIAMRFKVTMRALLAANPTITNSNQVVIGQKIVIPTR